MAQSHTRSTSINLKSPISPLSDIHQRPNPLLRAEPALPRISPSSSRLNLTEVHSTSRYVNGRYPAELDGLSGKPVVKGNENDNGGGSDTSPLICGLPLKYVSLVTLAVQNAALSIVMHYSRVSESPSSSYSPASAVLMNEVLKGSISYVIALTRTGEPSIPPTSRKLIGGMPQTSSLPWSIRIRRLNAEIFSPDCWKLSIPAILYVIQNSLQFVAVSNLPVATFQVSYQMKILTTAAFSVMLLGRRLTPTKWLALLSLAIGVGIVQIQTATGSQSISPVRPVGSAADAAPLHLHIMHPLTGFGAVTAACFTSGLAGVYFEMVLKGSKADLWVRNVQLSLFSIIPALLPIFFASPPPNSRGMVLNLFRNFGWWAWSTVATQVFGGLVTAVVIKYSDNILKGFATSLSIILSFLASVMLFHFRITPLFVIGSSVVLVATWMYNRPGPRDAGMSISTEKKTLFSTSPVEQDAPIIGQFPSEKSSRRGSPTGSTISLPSVLGLGGRDKAGQSEDGWQFGGESKTYLSAPYGSPFPSRTPSPSPPYPGTPYGAQQWR